MHYYASPVDQAEYVAADIKITDIVSDVVYFVHDGRNAWYRAWVQRYSHGCLHFNLSDAKAYCEKKRKNGTVFYIVETPALILSSESISVIITQFNVSQPLVGYSPVALISKKDYAGSVYDEAVDYYLLRGVSLKLAILSFDSDGRFWKAKPNKGEPVVVVRENRIFGENKDFSKIKLRSWRSQSNGGRYLLSWSEHDISCSGIAIQALVSEGE